MYEIDESRSKLGYCVLKQKYNLNQAFSKVSGGCFTFILCLIMIPLLGILLISTYKDLEQYSYISFALPIGIFFLVISVRGLIYWPRLPSGVIFSSGTKRIYIIDDPEMVETEAPSMSYGELNQITVREKRTHSNQRQQIRYEVVLQKSDTSAWTILGPYVHKDEAERERAKLVHLSQWSEEHSTAMGEVNQQRDAQEHLSHHWELPQKAKSQFGFTVEQDIDATSISWETKHPPQRKRSLYLSGVGFLFLALGMTTFTVLLKVLSLIPFGFALLIFRQLSHWSVKQEVKIFRDRISFTTPQKNKRKEVYVHDLQGLAFDLSPSGMSLRLVTKEAFEDLKALYQESDQVGVAESFKAMKHLLTASTIYIAYLSAGEVLALEELIQDTLHAFGDTELA